MVRLFFSILFCAFCISGVAQKVKLKKGEVLVDDNPWLKYTDCGTFDQTCSLLNMAGDEIIFIKTVTYKHVVPVTSSNKDGKVWFYEINFLGQKKKMEMQGFQKEIMRIIYAGKVVNSDGTLNPEMVERIVDKYGTPFSEQYGGGNAGTQTIIIRDEAPKPGVQINIGR